MAMAVPSPPPIQMAAMPRDRPRVSSAFSNVTMMRLPDAPMGWPSAQAPPFTFTRSGDRPISCMKAIGTTAKASFTSHRSTSSIPHPSRAISFCAAGTGAVVNHCGSWEWLACQECGPVLSSRRRRHVPRLSPPAPRRRRRSTRNSPLSQFRPSRTPASTAESFPGGPCRALIRADDCFGLAGGHRDRRDFTGKRVRLLASSARSSDRSAKSSCAVREN